MRCATSCATSWCRSTANIRSRSCSTPAATIPALSNARRITFEYVMLKGVNDTLADAKALVRLLKGIPAKINLIPFNPVARHEIRVLGLGADREILRDRLQRRLCLAGAHAARARHPRRLRPAQERDREALRPRAAGAARHGDDGLTANGQPSSACCCASSWCRSATVAAVVAGTLVILFGSWKLGQSRSRNPDAAGHRDLRLRVRGAGAAGACCSA